MVVVSYEVQSIDLIFPFPGILFILISLPLDEELQPIVLHPAVKHLFHFKMFFTIMENRRGKWDRFLTRNRVLQSRYQLDNREDWV
jgi:hypothetical protein